MILWVFVVVAILFFKFVCVYANINIFFLRQCLFSESRNRKDYEKIKKYS